MYYKEKHVETPYFEELAILFTFQSDIAYEQQIILYFLDEVLYSYAINICMYIVMYN